MINIENLIKDTQQAKYQLESYIYKTREAIDMSHNTYLTTNQERATIHENLNFYENWLYSEGMNTTKDIYLSQLNKL